MAVASKEKKEGGKSKIAVGAPAQRAQGSRKGKRAWRKNVDLDEVEQGLEEVREEERQFGSALHKKKDEDLFVVDTAGDDTVRKRLPKLSTRSLTAAKILAQRSAVPAVHTRSTPTSTSKTKLTRAEKERLLRIGKKDRKGPLNALVDHTTQGEGSALLEVSHAASQGAYDVWGAPSTSTAVAPKEDEFKPGLTNPHLPPLRAPNLAHTRSQIATPAVQTPHAGASYNPPAEAHTELLLQAHEIEAEREEKRLKEEAFKARVLAARNHGYGSGVGMDVDDLAARADEEEGKDGETIVKKLPQRKTKQQRKRALRAKLEARALAEKASRKRLSAQVDSARRFSKLTALEQAQAAARAAARKEARMERLRKGLGGVRLGKHRVPKGEVDVQLGEELSESLRGLRVEGSLWRDRFVSMQQRALIEARAQIQPSKGRKMKVYEKHDFKRFDAQP